MAVGETKEDNKKAAFDTWKTDVHGVTLKEWQAQSKKRLSQWMLERENTKNDNVGCKKGQRKKQPWKQEAAEWSAETAVSKNQEDAEPNNGEEPNQQTPPAKPTPQKSETQHVPSDLKSQTIKQTN
jgi:hypothetical protein